VSRSDIQFPRSRCRGDSVGDSGRSRELGPPSASPHQSPVKPLRVFLSYASEHKALVDRFREEAAANPSCPWFRGSFLEEPVVDWQRHAERLIRRSAATICLVGDSTWRSEPVNWEIRRAASFGKPVLAISLHSSEVRLPAALLDPVDPRPHVTPPATACRHGHRLAFGLAHTGQSTERPPGATSPPVACATAPASRAETSRLPRPPPGAGRA